MSLVPPLSKGPTTIFYMSQRLTQTLTDPPLDPDQTKPPAPSKGCPDHAPKGWGC